MQTGSWASPTASSLTAASSIHPTASPFRPLASSALKYLFLVLFLTCLASIWGVTAQEFEAQIFRHTNRERASRNLPALIYEDGLADLARLHSRNMLNQDFFSHTDKEGLKVADRQEKYYPQIMVSAIGENLFKITDSRELFSAREIVDGWMDSPGHRANILSPDFTHIGIGVVRRGAELYATQNFANPIVKLLDRLPTVTISNQITLRFQYLSTQTPANFRATIEYPDPKHKYWINETTYLEGSGWLFPSWTDTDQFYLVMDFPAGRGKYGIHFGWGDGYMEDAYEIQKR